MNYMVDQEDGGGMGFNVGSTWKPINMVAWMQKGHSINESLVTSTVYDTSKFNCNATVRRPVEGAEFRRRHHLSGKPAAGSDQVAQHHAGLDGVEHRPVRDRRRGQGDGYHNAISNASDIYSANSFQPPMTIGTVQASPLTMANVYATMGATAWNALRSPSPR